MADLVDRILERGFPPAQELACEGCASFFTVFGGQVVACPACGGSALRPLAEAEAVRLVIARAGTPDVMAALAMTEEELRELTADRGFDEAETQAFIANVRMLRSLQRLALEEAPHA